MKHIFNKSFKSIIIFTLAAYLFASLTPYIHPKYCFVFSFLAIGFPILLFISIIIFGFYLFNSRKKALIVLAIILCGYKNILTNIGFRFSHKKYNNNIKVLSWNVCDFVDNTITNKKVDELKYLEYIKMTNADIVCLQDMQTREHVDSVKAIKKFIAKSGYPYYYFSDDNDTVINHTLNCHYGTLILSKFPIINSHSINYNGKYFTESIALVNINHKGKMMRVFNTHLRSMYIKMPKEKRPSDFYYIIEDTNLLFHSSAFTKVKHYDTAHIAQVDMIRKIFDTTSVPFIFCADINSTPSSYVYHTLSRNLNDAFLQNHLGWQETYKSKIPSMRIDVVLTSKELQPTSYLSPRYRLSDHYPVITEISW